MSGTATVDLLIYASLIVATVSSGVAVWAVRKAVGMAELANKRQHDALRLALVSSRALSASDAAAAKSALDAADYQLEVAKAAAPPTPAPGQVVNDIDGNAYTITKDPEGREFITDSRGRKLELV